MKTLTSGILAIMLTLSLAPAQSYIDLADFGSGSYTVDAGSTTPGIYTQGLLGLTFSPSVSLGDTLGGIWNSAPFDWSSYADLADTIYLKVVFTGANPLSPMVLNIFNSDFSLNIQYEGTSVPIGQVIGANYLPFDLTPGTFSSAVLGDIGGAQITWGGGGSAGVRVEGVATVPEPSTYALLGLAGLALAGYAVRRRRA